MFRSMRLALLISGALWLVIGLGVYACHAQEIAPPPGAVSFCIRFPAECVESAATTATAAQLATAKAIDAQVNASTIAEHDPEHFGRVTFWTLIQDGRGDCKDFALTKLHLMRESGIAAGAMSILVVETRTQEMHAIALLNVDGTIWAFDNLREPALLSDSPYWPKARRKFGSPWHWEKA